MIVNRIGFVSGIQTDQSAPVGADPDNPPVIFNDGIHIGFEVIYLVEIIEMFDAEFVNTLAVVRYSVFISANPNDAGVIGIDTVDAVVRDAPFIVGSIPQVRQHVTFLIDDIYASMIGCHPDQPVGILHNILDHVTRQ